MPVKFVTKPRVSLPLKDTHNDEKVCEQRNHAHNIAAHHSEQKLVFRTFFEVQEDCKYNNLDSIIGANYPNNPAYTILQFLLECIEVLFLDEEHRAVPAALKLDHGGDGVPLQHLIVTRGREDLHLHRRQRIPVKRDLPDLIK